MDNDWRARPRLAWGPWELLAQLVLELGVKEGVFISRGRGEGPLGQAGQEQRPGPGRGHRQAAGRARQSSPGACEEAGLGGLESWAHAFGVASASGQPSPWAPCPSQPHPCHGKLDTVCGTVGAWRWGRTSQFPCGLPTPENAQDWELPRCRRGPSAPESPGKAPPVPALPGLLGTTWTVQCAGPRAMPTDADCPQPRPGQVVGAGWHRAGRGAALGRSLAGNVHAACYFYFSLSPRAGALCGKDPT